MDNLWAPWRVEYIENDKDDGCIFCIKPNKGTDEDNYIIHRGKTCFVMLNLYPYNNGHIMISPYQHQGSLDDLDDNEMLELIKTLRKSMKALTIAMKPHGFNVGINTGKASGAGFGDHLHIHVVPRWSEDTNFMPVVSNTRVVPESLESTRERLVEAWKSLKE